MIDGVRAELADTVTARGLSLLDSWLGSEEVKLEILSVLAAGRNLLLQGPVGSGKTVLAQSIVQGLGPVRLAGCWFNCLPGEPACPQCRGGLTPAHEIEASGADRFVRIQGSPDLFPEDLVGDIDPSSAFDHGVLDPRAFRPGRLVRANRRLCFVDEINRLSDRLQNLFLELLAEGALTVGGYEVRGEPEVETGPSVRATLAAFELAMARRRLRPGLSWSDVVREGLRVALRGRLTLRPTHRFADDPELFLASSLEALRW